MLKGLGTDIVELERIVQAVERHGELFLEHFLTQNELAESRDRKDRIAFAAGHWAAKEAVAKMLGCGIGAQCSWLNIEIRHDQNGAPEVLLSGDAAETQRKAGIKQIWLSISHEQKYAVATAVAE